MDTEGWGRRLTTGKMFTISLSGKRNIGDSGNDYVAALRGKPERTATVKRNGPFQAVRNLSLTV